MDDSGDVLLPPSAFHATQRVSSSDQFSSTNTDGNKHLPTPNTGHIAVPAIQTDTREKNDPPSSQQVALLLARLSTAEAQLYNVEEQLRASLEEKVHLQRSVNEARLQAQHLRAYYESHMGLEAEKLSPGSEGTTGRNRSTNPLEARVNELRSQIETMKRENAQIKSELELSVLRSNSLDAALKLQDKKRFLLTTSGTTKDETSEKAFCYWRDHVLRLLMQLEQGKVEREHSNGRMDRMRKELEKRCNDTQLELEATQHKLQASDATLTAVKGRAELLASEFHRQSSRLQTLEANASKERQNMLSSLRSIKTALISLGERVEKFAHESTEIRSDTHGDVSISMPYFVRRLRHLDRRLSFANNRLPLLRTQLALRSLTVSNRCDGWTQTEVVSVGGTQTVLNRLELEELLVHTQSELRQCVSERDCALKALEQNALSFHERVRAAEEEVHAEVVSLRDLVAILENDLKNKQKDLTECQIRLDNAKREQANIQQDAAKEQAQLRTQLADVQKELNKAMIDLKRTERLVEREADERRIHVSEMEKSYKSRIKTLEQALRSFQPDSCHWYIAGSDQGNTMVDTRATADSGECVTSAQLEALTTSISQLTRLADFLKSSNESIDAENDQPKEELQSTMEM